MKRCEVVLPGITIQSIPEDEWGGGVLFSFHQNTQVFEADSPVLVKV